MFIHECKYQRSQAGCANSKNKESTWIHTWPGSSQRLTSSSLIEQDAEYHKYLIKHLLFNRSRVFPQILSFDFQDYQKHFQQTCRCWHCLYTQNDINPASKDARELPTCSHDSYLEDKTVCGPRKTHADFAFYFF